MVIGSRDEDELSDLRNEVPAGSDLSFELGLCDRSPVIDVFAFALDAYVVS